MNQNQNNSKHTLGPWTHARMLIPLKSKDRRCGFVVNGPDADDQSLPTRICDLRVPSGINGFSEGEANARLIAAAPELLAVAGESLEMLAGSPSPEAIETVWAMLSAAIAKAEGQA